jgi:ribosomal subunit interface protein
MRVSVAARRCEIPDTIRTRTENQLGKLTKYEPRLSAAEVTFEVEKHLKKVEAVLSIDRGEPVIAGAEATEFREAVDLMADRLGKILRRRRSHKKDHKGPSVAKTAPLEG